MGSFAAAATIREVEIRHRERSFSGLCSGLSAAKRLFQMNSRSKLDLSNAPFFCGFSHVRCLTFCFSSPFFSSSPACVACRKYLHYDEMLVVAQQIAHNATR